MRALILAILASCASAPLLAQSAAPATKADQATVPFVRADAEAAVTELAKQLEDNFVFPDAGKAYAAKLRSKLAARAYSSFPSAKAFAEAVTAEQIEPLLVSFDGLQANFEALRAIGQEPADTVVSLPTELARPDASAVDGTSAPAASSTLSVLPPPQISRISAVSTRLPRNSMRASA